MGASGKSYAFAVVLTACMPLAPAFGQGFGTSFGTGGTAGRAGQMSNAGPFQQPGQNAGRMVGRPGPFGQGVQSGFFGDSSGLGMLEMAGLSAFFNRDPTGLSGGPLGGPGRGMLGAPGSGLGGFGMTPFARGLNRGFDGRDASRPIVRTQLRVGFEIPDAIPPAVQQRLVRTLETSDLQSPNGIRITTVLPETPVPTGVLVILRGQVATEEDRRVAEQLALLDPGVAAVRNELVVSPAAGPRSQP